MGARGDQKRTCLGIPEYWIVDYLAIGSRSFLGNPKRPTIFVYRWVRGEYQVQSFQGSDTPDGTLRERIVSPSFSELELTCAQVFASSQVREL